MATARPGPPAIADQQNTPSDQGSAALAFVALACSAPRKATSCPTTLPRQPRNEGDQASSFSKFRGLDPPSFGDGTIDNGSTIDNALEQGRVPIWARSNEPSFRRRSGRHFSGNLLRGSHTVD